MFANRFQEIRIIYLWGIRILNCTQSMKAVSLHCLFSYKHNGYVQQRTKNQERMRDHKRPSFKCSVVVMPWRTIH
jgi:hypothetical protein